MKLSIEDKRAARRKLRRMKELKMLMKPFENEYEELHAWVKQKVMEQKKDFEFPDCGTTTFPTTRESYDLRALDELIENGTIDSDTAQIILKCRKSQQIIVTRIK